jgi:PhnB protein
MVSRLGVIVSVVCSDASTYLTNLKSIFSCHAKTINEYKNDDGKILHSETNLFSRLFYCNDFGVFQPSKPLQKGQLHGDVMLSLLVPDPKVIEKKALENGATSLFPVEKQFWGGDWGAFRDPSGVVWAVLGRTHDAVVDREKEKKMEVNGENENCPVDPLHQRNVTTEIGVKNADEEIHWIQNIFSAKVEEIHRSENGSILHSELTLNDGGMVYVHTQPQTSATLTISLSVKPGSAIPLAEKFVSLGGKITMPIESQFWGDVYGRVIDNFGVEWSFLEINEKTQQEKCANGEEKHENGEIHANGEENEDEKKRKRKDDEENHPLKKSKESS